MLDMLNIEVISLAVFANSLGYQFLDSFSLNSNV